MNTSHHSTLQAREVLVDMMLDILRVNLQQSAFAVTAYGTDVSTTHAEILEEFARNPEVNIPQLAELLGLNKSSISRAITELCALEYLEASDEKGSKVRRKLLRHTTKGKQFIRRGAKFNQRWISSKLSHLSTTAQNTLTLYLERFAHAAADSFSPATTTTLHERIFNALVSLTRAHGITNGNYAKSGYPVTDWLILFELHYHHAYAHEMALRLAISQNALSQILRRYQTQKMISIAASDQDQRMNELTVTTAGLERLLKIELCARKQYGAELAIFDIKELREFVDLMSRFVGTQIPYRRILLNEKLFVRAIRDEEVTLRALRYLLVRELAHVEETTYPLSDTLFAATNLNYEIHDGSAVVGGVEFITTSSQYKINNFVLREDLRSEISRDEILHVLTMLLPDGVSLDQGTASVLG